MNADEYDLVKVLNDPEDYYPGNFETAKKAAAFLMCLCQKAADKIQRMETKDEPIGYVSRDCDGVLGSDLYYTPEEAVEDTMGTGTAEAVYLHPTKTAPMKPMTEEEILEVARDHYNPYQRAEITFARAIERHHGIGGG